MPAAYSLDLRTKVVQAYKDGRGTIEEVANLFNIAEKTLKNYLARERQRGHLEEDIRIGQKSSVEEHHRCYIKQRILGLIHSSGHPTAPFRSKHAFHGINAAFPGRESLQ